MNERLLPVVALVAGALIFGIMSEKLVRADADIEKGQAAFEKCAACHSLDGTEGDGPTLKGVFGRKAGSLEDFRYSAAMSRSSVIWDAATLDAFTADPQGYIAGNRMAFAGLSDKSERDDLVEYLEQATKSLP